MWTVACKNSVVIQADHRKNLGEKVQKCSNYYYWKSKHSKEAYELELKKCEPRCRFCHFMRTDRDNWFSYGTHGRQLYHKKKNNNWFYKKNYTEDPVRFVGEK